LKRELQQELQEIWDALNIMDAQLDNTKVGEPKSGDTSQTIRLIQGSNGYYVEGRFKDGWARLNTSLEQIGKK
jgi:hypothetical protein